MANERYDGAKYILGDPESAYADGTVPTTVRQFKSFSSRIVPNVIRRDEYVSPEGPGRAPVMAGAMVELNMESELVLPTLDGSGAGIDSSQYPTIHDVLHAAQAKQIVDNTDETITYIFPSRGNQGSVWYDELINEDESDTNLLKCEGAAVALTWEWAHNEVLMVSAEGKALGFKATGLPVDIYGSGGAPGGVNESDKTPEVGLGATIRIIDLSDDSLLGGGTLASPSQNVQVKRVSANYGYEVQEDGGLNSTGGPSAILVKRTGLGTIEVDVQVQDAAEWNPYTKMFDSNGDPVPFELDFRLQNGTRHGQFLHYGFLVDVGEPELDGPRLYQTLTFELASPEDPTDGDPAVGVNSNQRFAAGTNQGLRFQPTATVPKGIAAWQFWTDNS